MCLEEMVRKLPGLSINSSWLFWKVFVPSSEATWHLRGGTVTAPTPIAHRAEAAGPHGAPLRPAPPGVASRAVSQRPAAAAAGGAGR